MLCMRGRSRKLRSPSNHYELKSQGSQVSPQSLQKKPALPYFNFSPWNRSQSPGLQNQKRKRSCRFKPLNLRWFVQQPQTTNGEGNKIAIRYWTRHSSKYFSFISLDSHSLNRWSVLLSFPLYRWANGTKRMLCNLPNTHHSHGAEPGLTLGLRHPSWLCRSLLCTASCSAVSPFLLANCLPALGSLLRRDSPCS